jgi:hypothetical protein
MLQRLVATSLMCLSILCVGAHSQEFTGIDSVFVDVVAEKTCDRVISESIVKQDAQLKLVVAGLKVVGEQKFAPLTPTVLIRISCIAADDIVKAINIRASLQRSVKIEGQLDNLAVIADVWDSVYILTCGLYVCRDSVREVVVSELDGFIDAYRRQNRK